MGSVSIDPGTSLGPVSLTVSNLTRALGFYDDTLGLRMLDHQTGTAVLGEDHGLPLIALVENPNAQPRPPRTTGLYHYAILLPTRGDLARLLRHLVERRYSLQGAADHGVSEALYLADPDGNGIEVYADRPKNAWPQRHGRLEMFTDPLDVNDLLGTDAGEWKGIPLGTRIGHVHLHVADLSEAERFYCEVLGFDLMQRFPEGRGVGPSALFLSAGGYHHHLGLNTWAGVGAPPPPSGALGLRHFTLYLPEETALTRLTERLDRAGVSREPLVDGRNMSSAFIVRDPSGNSILMDTAEKHCSRMEG